MTAWVSALNSVLRVQSQLKKDIPSNLIEKKQQLNLIIKIASSTASPAELEKTLIISCLSDTRGKIFGSALVLPSKDNSWLILNLKFY